MGSSAASPGWNLLLRGVPRLEPASPPAASSSGRSPPTATATQDAVHGAPQAHLLNPSDAAWLALIALGGGMPTARIATLVWPGQSTEAGALNNLRQRVLRLRRRTGARLVELAAVPVLAPDLHCPPLDPGALRDDPHAWDDTWLAAHDHAGQAEFGLWLAQQRQALAVRRRDALASLAAEAEAHGELARALRLASVLQLHDPMSEHAARRLMRLHYLRGDRAAAVAVFEACEALLREELGVRPGDETLALLRTIEAAVPPAMPSPAPGPVPVGLLQPPRLVGRDDLLARLAQTHADGAIAVVVGEAGIGKTRLLRSHAALHPGAVYVQARPGDASVPFGLALRWLAALGQPVLDTQGAAARLQWRAVEAVMAAAMVRGAAAMLLDDLHFADAASLDLLRRLLDSDRLATLPWLLAHRPPAAVDDLAGLLDSLREAPRARWLQVSALDEAACAELLQSLNLPNLDSTALAPPLWRHSGGNPLYLLETLRAMRGADGRWRDGELPRPLAIDHLITQRLARLSRPALALARVAAVAAPDFSAALAERALGQPVALLADAWAELEAADILRDEGFAHDLVHDAIRSGVPAAVRRRLHRVVAQHLAAQAAPAARVAPHWWAAEAWGQAMRCFDAASGEAQAIARQMESANLKWQAARAAWRAGEGGVALDWGLRAATAIAIGQSPEAANDCLAELQVWGTTLGQPSWHLALQARLALLRGEAAQAQSLAQQALAGFAPSQMSGRLHATVVLAVALGYQGQADAALQHCQRVQDLADAADDGLALTYWANFTVVLMQAERRRDACRVAEHVLVLARRVKSDDEIPTLMNLTALHMQAGRLTQALPLAEEVAVITRAADHVPNLAHWNDIHLGMVLGGLGRYAEAVERLQSGAAGLAALGSQLDLVVVADNHLALLYLVMGQTARAARLLRDRPPALSGFRLAARLAVQAAVARANGQDDAALLHEAMSLCENRTATATRLVVAVDLVRHAPAGTDVLATCRRLQQEADAADFGPLGLRAAACGLQWQLLHAPDSLDAADVADFAARLPNCRSLWLDLPAQWHLCARAWQALDREADARRCLGDALHALMNAARHTVPEAFRSSYLDRQSAHLALRRAASDWGIAGGLPGN